MRIGIDISQTAYPNTGVANYIKNLVKNLLKIDKNNEYVLFFSSLRGKLDQDLKDLGVQIKQYPFPPLLLDFLWNRLHILPIEWLIGEIDIFISSDWTEPPVKKAEKATILYDLIVFKRPKETDRRIIATQKRKLKWVKKESKIVFCISEATKKDAQEILKLTENKLKVAYPGGII